MDKSLSPNRSPSKYTTADPFSSQIYGNYTVLDSVLLHYLDIESLIRRHQVNPEVFESQGSLNLLAQRFDLPTTTTFSAFLDAYDAKYPTVRSYLLPGANPKAIMLKAAEAGELKAFYLGLRRNPKYKNPTFLDRALKIAARGGHPAMIDLIKDLGGDNYMNELRGTAQGGHLEKLKLMITKGQVLGRVLLFRLIKDAVRYGQLATAKYLISRTNPDAADWEALIPSAYKSGNQGMIGYVISHAGEDYTGIILRAISDGNLELAMRYLEEPGLDYDYIFRQAFNYGYLELAKLVARDRKIDQDLVDNLMGRISKTTTYEMIEYLISLGGTNYKGLVHELVINDQLELFKRYCRRPGVNLIQAFNLGLKDLNVEIVEFMLEQRLVPVTVQELNRYLRLVGFNPELIDLLFSLGATDYRFIVKTGLIDDDLELADKYFDQAPTIRLNSVFKRCTSVPVYQYIMSRGTITQKTIDATLKRLARHKHNYMKEKKYLRSLTLHEVSSPAPV
jgi:hypothetical protein